ncbi:MAG: hypothetical protein QOG30_2482 [Acidimicrobiaceae bacterium]
MSSFPTAARSVTASAATRCATFEHDGWRFDVTDTGPADGETVVLLHGFPQSRACWSRVAPLLVHAGFRVVAPDQRGYSPGARPRGRRPYRLERLAADVIALIDTVGVERAHVVGHDWGGAVAWALSARHPDRLASMTSLATPHGRAMRQALWSSNQLARSWYIAMFQIPWLPDTVLRGAASAAFQRALVRSGLGERDAEIYAAWLRQPGAATAAINWYRALPFATKADLGRSTVPTLYVYGSADVALGQRAADLTADHVDAAYHYEVLDGASHWLPECEAETVAALIVNHARRSAASDRS